MGMNEQSSRLSLKKLMEGFGEVVGCHIGNRGIDYPVVRFQSADMADAAVKAMQNGQVYLDGAVLQGERRQRTDPPKDPRPAHRALEMTSRDLVGGGGGDDRRSRDGGGGGMR